MEMGQEKVEGYHSLSHCIILPFKRTLESPERKQTTFTKVVLGSWRKWPSTSNTQMHYGRDLFTIPFPLPLRTANLVPSLPARTQLCRAECRSKATLSWSIGSSYEQSSRHDDLTSHMWTSGAWDPESLLRGQVSTDQETHLHLG